MENSMLSRTGDIREAAKIIADNMLAVRPRCKAVYAARRFAAYIRDEAPLRARHVDLYKLYPRAVRGDWAYVSVFIETEEGFDAALMSKGAEKIFIDGRQYIPDGGLIKFRAARGRTLVEFECAAGDSFGVSFTPSVVYYPGMLAKDYLAHVSILCPMAEYDGEEGAAVSALCGERGVYAYPKPPEKSEAVDFNEIYPNEEGVYAYALTYSASEGKADFDFYCTAKVWVNGKAAAETEGGKVRLTLKKDDFILIKCERGKLWKFSFGGDFYLPFLKKTRSVGCDIATVGTFGKSRAIDLRYGPELYFDLKKTYRNYRGESCFFKLAARDDYITADMRTCFFSQWFYALMVGEYGLLDAANLTKEEKYQRYFIESMSAAAEFYGLQSWQKSVFGEAAFLQRGMLPQDLDSIGAVGMNLCELYALTGNGCAAKIADRLINAISVIPRFKDGTFHRGRTMWADDTYMSCPFMLRYGLLFGNEYWLGECVKQILGFKERLFMKDKGIFSHIYFVEEQKANRVPWGRGNGWVFVTLSELLEKLPADISGYDELKELYIEFAHGILVLQGENGMWRQVLDIEETYYETSCTAMFIIGLCRGIRLGLLGDEVKENIKKAYDGLMTHKIDSGGNVYGVCRGSSCSMEAKYYIELGTVDNDDHGTGIVLSALYEMSRIE